jgi:hypothetical protein
VIHNDTRSTKYQKKQDLASTLLLMLNRNYTSQFYVRVCLHFCHTKENMKDSSWVLPHRLAALMSWSSKCRPSYRILWGLEILYDTMTKRNSSVLLPTVKCWQVMPCDDKYRVFQKDLNDIKHVPVRNTTLPLMKYGVQYIRTHLKFIWSAPNYFIIQPLGGRLTTKIYQI